MRKMSAYNQHRKYVKDGMALTETELTWVHELELAYLHKKAFTLEFYEICGMIQKEVDRRIANNLIDRDLMKGFMYYDPLTMNFEGKPKYEGLNGLFNNYNP